MFSSFHCTTQTCSLWPGSARILAHRIHLGLSCLITDRAVSCDICHHVTLFWVFFSCTQIYVWQGGPRVNVLGCSSVSGREQKCPAASHRCVATYQPLSTCISSHLPTASRLKKNESKNLTGRAIVSARPRGFLFLMKPKRLISSQSGTRWHTNPHSGLRGFLWYFHNIAPSLRRSPRIPKLTKPALLDGAAKRNAKSPSHKYTGGSISIESSHWICPWFVPGAHAAAGLVPSQFPVSISASTPS